MYCRAMKGQSFSAYMIKANIDYKCESEKKLELYDVLCKSVTAIDKLDFEANLFMSNLYDSRQIYMKQQFKNVEDWLLKFKSHSPKNMIVLNDKFVHKKKRIMKIEHNKE